MSIVALLFGVAIFFTLVFIAVFIRPRALMGALAIVDLASSNSRSRCLTRLSVGSGTGKGGIGSFQRRTAICK